MPLSMNKAETGQIPFFAALPKAEAESLARTLERVALPPGSVLFREDERSDRFYIILEGEVEVVKSLGTPDERVVGVRGPGDFFGEMGLLNPDSRRTASVRVRSETSLLEMSRSQFDELLDRRPSLAYAMVRALSLRLRETDNATIRDLQEKNRELAQAYQNLKTAQAQIIENERLKRELEVAERIQRSLLPKEVPTLSGWRLSTFYQPARAVGGDFYDFLTFPDGRLGLVIGDVTGKGMPAALVMATTRSVLRGVAQRAGPPGEVLTRVNDLIQPDLPEYMFVTCLYALLEPSSGEVEFANAGHCLPLHRKANGVEAVWAAGMPLGLLPNRDYVAAQLRLAPGDCLLLSSDGLTEAHAEGGEMFSEPRVHGLMDSDPSSSPGSLIAALTAELASFTGGGWEQEDDITLVALARNGDSV